MSTARDEAVFAGPVDAALAYGVPVFVALQTAGRELCRVAVGPVPTPTFDIIVPALAVAVALAADSCPYRARPLRPVAVTLGAWLGVEAVGPLLVNPATAHVSGSLPLLVDAALVWVGMYALATAVVYGFDWTAVRDRLR